MHEGVLKANNCIGFEFMKSLENVKDGDLPSAFNYICNSEETKVISLSRLDYTNIDEKYYKNELLGKM